MRFKVVVSRKSQRRELQITLQRGEALDTQRAAWLIDERSQLFLEFGYDQQWGGAVLRYDVEGLGSLKTYLGRHELSYAELCGLLKGVEQVLAVCTERRYAPEALLFDPQYVFVNRLCMPRFACVPLVNREIEANNNPLTLLRALGSPSHLIYADDQAEALSRRLKAYVLDQNGMFSANGFRRFLAHEGLGSESKNAGVYQLPDVRDVVAGWAGSGDVQGTGGQASSSTFFWNPLDSQSQRDAEARKEEALREAERQRAAIAWDAFMQQQDDAADVEVLSDEVPEEPQAQEASEQLFQEMPATPLKPIARTVVVDEEVQAAVSKFLEAEEEEIPRIPKATICRVSTGDEYPLEKDVEVKLGRGSMSDIQLTGNARLSRLHASVYWDGDTIRVHDLGSANGVRVGGVRLERNGTAKVEPGQSFLLADEELTVRVEW